MMRRSLRKRKPNPRYNNDTSNKRTRKTIAITKKKDFTEQSCVLEEISAGKDKENELPVQAVTEEETAIAAEHLCANEELNAEYQTLTSETNSKDNETENTIAAKQLYTTKEIDTENETKNEITNKANELPVQPVNEAENVRDSEQLHLNKKSNIKNQTLSCDIHNKDKQNLLQAKHFNEMESTIAKKQLQISKELDTENKTQNFTKGRVTELSAKPFNETENAMDSENLPVDKELFIQNETVDCETDAKNKENELLAQPVSKAEKNIATKQLNTSQELNIKNETLSPKNDTEDKENKLPAKSVSETENTMASEQLFITNEIDTENDITDKESELPTQPVSEAENVRDSEQLCFSTKLVRENQTLSCNIHKENEMQTKAFNEKGYFMAAKNLHGDQESKTGNETLDGETDVKDKQKLSDQAQTPSKEENNVATKQLKSSKELNTENETLDCETDIEDKKHVFTAQHLSETKCGVVSEYLNHVNKKLDGKNQTLGCDLHNKDKGNELQAMPLSETENTMATGQLHENNKSDPCRKAFGKNSEIQLNNTQQSSKTSFPDSTDMSETSVSFQENAVVIDDERSMVFIENDETYYVTEAGAEISTEHTIEIEVDFNDNILFENMMGEVSEISNENNTEVIGTALVQTATPCSTMINHPTPTALYAIKPDSSFEKCYVNFIRDNKINDTDSPLIEREENSDEEIGNINGVLSDDSAVDPSYEADQSQNSTEADTESEEEEKSRIKYLKQKMLKRTAQPTSSSGQAQSTSTLDNPRSRNDKPIGHPDTESDHEEGTVETEKVIRPRKRRVNKDQWKGNEAKKNRNSGKAYKSRKTEYPARTFKYVDCQCRFKCNESFPEEKRRRIFENYWKLGSYDRQRQFVHNHMQTISKKRRTTNKEENRRVYTTNYYLPEFPSDSRPKCKATNKVQVCKNVFISTLSVGKRLVEYTRERPIFNYEDNRGRHSPPNLTKSEDVEFVKSHINSFPKMSSHYCRSATKRKYLDSNLSLSKMHRLYREKCQKENVRPVALSTYRAIFNYSFNLGFHKPKKDRCSTCEKAINLENTQSPEYIEHQKRKEEIRTQRQVDKERVRKNEDNHLEVIGFDLEKVIKIPKSQVSDFYYCPKISCYNFTVYSLKNNEATCYVWAEDEGKRGSNEIASCLYDFNTKCARNGITDVVYYSDSCGGQNKNMAISAMCLKTVNTTPIETISHYYYECGHSQSECDNVHSRIEKHIKNMDLYTPGEFFDSVRHAKETQPVFSVIELKHDAILDFKKLATDTMANTELSEDGSKVKWKGNETFRVAQYTKGSYKIELKISPHATATQILDTKSKPRKRARRATAIVQKPKPTDSVLVQAYKAKLPIPQSKLKALLKLLEKGIIHPKYAAYYKSLNGISVEVEDELEDTDSEDPSEELNSSSSDSEDK